MDQWFNKGGLFLKMDYLLFSIIFSYLLDTSTIQYLNVKADSTLPVEKPLLLTPSLELPLSVKKKEDYLPAVLVKERIEKTHEKPLTSKDVLVKEAGGGHKPELDSLVSMNISLVCWF